MYEYLRRNKDRIKGGRIPYLFVDALNCTNGCLYGTGVDNRKTMNEDVFINIQKIRADSNKNNQDIKETINKLISESGRLSEIVDSVNQRAESLVASSEETTAAISMMQNVTKQVEESLKQVLEA